jgi:hypothetical protein
MRATCLALFATALLTAAPPGAAGPARPGPARPAHLGWAVRMVEHLKLKNTSYRHRNVSVKWKGVGGAQDYESHADCSGFLNALLGRAYGYGEDTFKAWLGARRPLARHYHDAIVRQERFRRIGRLEDARPGDVLAIKYRPGDPTTSNTGHVLLVVEAPRTRESTAPKVPGTTQWEVVVIDQSRSGHGKADTRRRPGGSFATGLGRGVLRVYTDNGGKVAGYSWSTEPGSRFRPQSDRHLVIGRLRTKPGA